MRFWRDSGGSGRDLNGGPPCGQVRVLVVGDSVTVHLGDDQHITYSSLGCSSNSINGDAERNFFVELWDVSGHERYKECRSLFYSQINGVIFVHDLSQRKTKTNLNKWAVEVAESGTFSAPLGSGGPGGLPVPYLVIANKVDIAPRDGKRVSSGNLVDVARQWVEKQGLLPASEELPLLEGFPGNSGLLTAAKDGRYDKEALMKFFRMLIRRRYFSNELPAPSPWSLTPREDTILPVETGNDDDLFQRKRFFGCSPNTEKLLSTTFRHFFNMLSQKRTFWFLLTISAYTFAVTSDPPNATA
ncbi:hypothetical protein PR202_ga08062 [Eleusine coracana subsp. coracana]|uniref:Uncharacterized protein n=1 Tax=Eleusine coracana subsp. coracana TaxID=191504 RepID=A0AAV5BZ74_ELECO|nr:hypothetical protein PR202_ga08062 [Eleusine coracana subsp. coracana]